MSKVTLNLGDRLVVNINGKNQDSVVTGAGKLNGCEYIEIMPFSLATGATRIEIQPAYDPMTMERANLRYDFNTAPQSDRTPPTS